MQSTTSGSLGQDVDAAMQKPKFPGLTYVPDDNNYVKVTDTMSKENFMMPTNQTVFVAASEKQWQISPTVKGPFPLKRSVTDQDYIEFNLAGGGLQGIYDVNQLLIMGTLQELGNNGPHNFGPALLFFDRIEFRSDTDDNVYRTYDFSGNYARFGFLNTNEQIGSWTKWCEQFGLTNTFVGFGPAGLANQIQSLETKSFVIPLYGSPLDNVPPALLGVAGPTGNFTMRIFMKTLDQMKETVPGLADSFKIDLQLRIITEQRGSQGVADFQRTIQFLEQPNTFIQTLMLHEVRTSGTQSGGGFLPAFGPGATFDFVPGIAANAWYYAFFFIVQDRPAAMVASADYNLIPFFTVSATNNGADNVFVRGVRDGTQDFINEGSFLAHNLTMSSKAPGSLLANQPMWMMCAGAQFARGLKYGVIDGFWPMMTNDLFRFRGGNNKVNTFAPTNKITIYIYVIARFWADIARSGVKAAMYF